CMTVNLPHGRAGLSDAAAAAIARIGPALGRALLITEASPVLLPRVIAVLNASEADIAPADLSPRPHDERDLARAGRDEDRPSLGPRRTTPGCGGGRDADRGKGSPESALVPRRERPGRKCRRHRVRARPPRPRHLGVEVTVVHG